ncbi:hypothetical protein MLD38_012662 [Melastoma candidum]|uniref:Uncharacterized protein n=1 Tax=Melastoma candidum TaxID=119954 RepID=A0ACB9R765_9MYRT|nr:hypothetical protein MLD38_012662 [Melastoma candidum]
MSCSEKGLNVLQQTPVAPQPLVPKPVFRTEVSPPSPMSFVQADRAAFKQVVQLLTGSPETSVRASDSILASLPARSSKGGGVHPRRPGGSKLYERRNSHPKNNLVLNTVARWAAYSNQGGGFTPATPEALSPSMLDFPPLALSPVTPLNGDLYNKPSPCLEEEKAIAEKRFYLHPSPRTMSRNAEPKLLQLFPSPRD